MMTAGFTTGPVVGVGVTVGFTGVGRVTGGVVTTGATGSGGNVVVMTGVGVATVATVAGVTGTIGVAELAVVCSVFRCDPPRFSMTTAPIPPSKRPAAVTMAMILLRELGAAAGWPVIVRDTAGPVVVWACAAPE